MSDPTQTELHDPAPQEDAPGAYQANVDAHLPSLSASVIDLVENPKPWWNPETNEWAPSNTPHNVAGPGAPQQPSHGDVMTADPMIDQPGVYGGMAGQGGGTPDARPNLLDAVRGSRTPVPAQLAPVQHQIVVETKEVASSANRARVVRVQVQGAGQNAQQAVTLLENNPNRDRALIKCITTNGVIVLAPLRQGGVPTGTGVPSGNMAGYPLATGDPIHEVKSSDGVEAYIWNTGAQTFCDVAIWEEMKTPHDEPGLSG
jgi:hypothetical protein